MAKETVFVENVSVPLKQASIKARHVKTARFVCLDLSLYFIDIPLCFALH